MATDHQYDPTDHAQRRDHDPVNHPQHYTAGGIECIDALEAALGADGAAAFCRGNAIKYLWRAGKKGDQVEDLRKAVWYIEREAAIRERQEKRRLALLGQKQAPHPVCEGCGE